MTDLCTAARNGGHAMATFVGMWAVMMIPMMLPSLAPALRRYASLRPAAIAALGYFAVWTAVGLAAYPIDRALGQIRIGFPFVSGIAVVVAGLLQFTAWKSRRLACCRVATPARGAWRHGLRLGADCVACCGNLMIGLVAIGTMNVAAMVAVTVAIAVERRAPRLARPIGAIVVAAGASFALSG